jgi:electron transfer flavoprotein alpha subunit
MSVLVFLEPRNGTLDRGSLGVLSKAASLGAGKVGAVLCGGGNLKAFAEEAGRFGARRVYLVEHETLDAPLPQPRVDVLAGIVRVSGYDTVLLSNSVLGADVAAGLAARLDAGLNWDLVDIDWRDGQPVGTRLALQDSVLVEVGWTSQHRVGLFRPGAFEPTPTTDVEMEIEQVAAHFEDHSARVRLLSREVVASGDGVSVEDADVIVTGGMGLGGSENFSLAEQLAEVLGGAVGATRAAVYAGWYPRSSQIGQTGKSVSPKLYVALGVSGAIQHKVGMQSSKLIVSINKDPGAPIFECSDLAVVGDVHTIVPRLTELLRNRKSS